MNMKRIVALSFSVMLLHKSSLAMDNDPAWQPFLMDFSSVFDQSPLIHDKTLIINDKLADPQYLHDLSMASQDPAIIPHQEPPIAMPSNNNNNNAKAASINTDVAFLMCREASLESAMNNANPTHNNAPALAKFIMCALCKASIMSSTLDQHTQQYHSLITIAQPQQPAKPQSEQNPRVPGKKSPPRRTSHYSPNKQYPCRICNHKFTTFYYLPKHELYCRKNHPFAWALADANLTIKDFKATHGNNK